ncbi:hypothetical protein XAPC_836 [Xanthomonas citri pv. punicae str. LMG 859]|nr:hypothetical protein XAPC_836 [Xanthomonas citri pv. punicae str. LMG 859]
MAAGHYDFCHGNLKNKGCRGNEVRDVSIMVHAARGGAGDRAAPGTARDALDATTA